MIQELGPDGLYTCDARPFSSLDHRCDSKIGSPSPDETADEMTVVTERVKQQIEKYKNN